MQELNRRSFITRSGTLFAFVAGSKVLWLTPAQAKAARLELEVLKPKEGASLDALGETLAPGAEKAGMAHYIDRQLAGPLTENKLMLRYLGVEPPFTDFYRSGLAALDAMARGAGAKSFADLKADARADMVRTISGSQPSGWAGPPAPLFYFALRADAVDVVYGTPQGFERLGVPYMPHILPPAESW